MMQKIVHMQYEWAMQYWEIALKHDVKTSSTGNYLGHKPL